MLGPGWKEWEEEMRTIGRGAAAAGAVMGCLLTLIHKGLLIALALGCAWSIWAASRAPQGSVEQSLWVEGAAGCAAIFAIPYLLRAGIRYKWQVPFFSVLAAAGSLVATLRTAGLVQSLLVEATSILFFFGVGDLMFVGWMAAIAEQREAIRPADDRS